MLLIRHISIYLKAMAILAYFSSPAITGPKILVDMETGDVLQAEDADMSWHPASITKVMTAHLALKAVKAGKLELNQSITISKHASSQPASKLGLAAGSTIRLEDALLIMLTRSANDLATAIGEAVAGTEEAFASLMTKEARQLGMSATIFKNANGLHHVEQVTTARDIAILGLAVHRAHPEHIEMFSKKQVSFGKTQIRNTNSLLGVYPGLNGMKTGYICASGFNIVATAQNNEKGILAVVLGEPSSKQRTASLKKLLDYGWSANLTNESISNFAIAKPHTATDLRTRNCGKTPTKEAAKSGNGKKNAINRL